MAAIKRCEVPEEIRSWALDVSEARISKDLKVTPSMAKLLHSGKPVWLSPLELAVLESNWRVVRRMRKMDVVPLDITVDSRLDVRHSDVIRMMATFVAQHAELLNRFKTTKGQKASVYRYHSMYKPLYDFGELITNEIVPFLRYVWNEYPKCRHELFYGTGFEEAMKENKWPSP